MTLREQRIREMIRDCEQARPGAVRYLAVFYELIAKDSKLESDHVHECDFESIDEFLADPKCANMRLAGAIALLSLEDEPVPGHPGESGLHCVIWPERDRYEFHHKVLAAIVQRRTEGEAIIQAERKASRN